MSSRQEEDHEVLQKWSRSFVAPYEPNSFKRTTSELACMVSLPPNLSDRRGD